MLGGWVALEMAASGYGPSVVALAPPGLWQTPPVVSRRWASRAAAATRRILSPVRPTLGRWPHLKRRAVRGIVVDPTRVSTDQLVRSARDRRDAKGAEAARRVIWGSRFTGGASIAVPVCIAYGNDDRVVGSRAERELLGPSARRMSMPDCGPAMSRDQPEACLAVGAETSALASA